MSNGSDILSYVLSGKENDLPQATDRSLKMGNPHGVMERVGRSASKNRSGKDSMMEEFKSPRLEIANRGINSHLGLTTEIVVKSRSFRRHL